MSVPKHIVAVGGLVTDDQGRILMIRSPRRGWEFPGGQVEEGEDLIAALQREVFEETGITVMVGALAGVYSNLQSHIVMFDFLCQPTGGTLTTSAESLVVEWVARADALPRMTRPALQERLRQMLEFDGRIVYRAYTFHPAEVPPAYRIHREQTV